MKKLFTLAVCLMAGMASFAQDIDESFVFVDAAGNELTNDTVITRTDVTEDPFGDNYISSGLYVKNVSGGVAYLKIESAVTQLPSGTTHSICFPGNCINHTAVGTYESKDPEGEANESVSDMRAEWINKGVEGTCTVTYTVKVYEYEGKQPNNFGIPVDTYSFLGDGRKITVNYTTKKQGLDNPFVFVDANGNELATDTVLTRADITEDASEGNYISSGLSVKNVSSGTAYLKIETSVTQLPAGTVHSIGFSGDRVNHIAIGTYESKDVESEVCGSKSNMGDKWIYYGVEGTCTVTYTIKVYDNKGDLIGDGRKITVNYTTDKSAGISGAKTEANELHATYYTMDGRCVAQPGKGLYIKKAKLADGTVKTVKMVIK